jgi:hypothetical protein
MAKTQMKQTEEGKSMIDIAGLQKQINETELKEAALFAERSQISFEAVVERRRPAIARLAEVNGEIAALRDQGAALAAAMAEAKKREAAAAHAAAAEAERERARKAAPIAQRLAERGAVIDAASRAYNENVEGIREDVALLARLGVPVPSHDLVRVNLNRAHDTATAALDKTRPMSPAQRTGFDRLSKSWAAPAQSWIATRLNTNAARDVDAA